MDSGSQVLDSSLCQWNLDSEFQSLVEFRIPWAVFWIPKPRIPDSTSKNFTDSGMGNLLYGAMKDVLLVSQKNLNPGQIWLKNYSGK